MNRNDIIKRILAARRRRILVLSAGSERSCIACAYVETSNESWQLLAQSTISYPRSIAQILEGAHARAPLSLTLEEQFELGSRLTHLYAESVRTTLAQCPSRKSQPHLLILGRFGLALLPESATSTRAIRFGSAQWLASHTGLPILCDYTANNSLAVSTGVSRLVSAKAGITLYINIGINSHFLLIDTLTGSVLQNSQTGPGNRLVDFPSAKTHADDSFDRDGASAQTGTPDTAFLEEIYLNTVSTPPQPLCDITSTYLSLLNTPRFLSLSLPDQLATASALTARVIYDLSRDMGKGIASPTKVVISGGGAHNLSLMNHISLHFNPVPVVTVEELGLLPELLIPVAIGISTIGIAPDQPADEVPNNDLQSLLLP